MEIVLPHLSYPSPIRLRSHRRVLHQYIVMYLASMLRGLQSARRVCKAHPRALTAEPCVGKASAAVQAASIEVAVGTAKGVHLWVCTTQVLAPAEGALWLAMRREARLVEGSANAWPGAEAPDLRRHIVVRRRMDANLWWRLLVYVWLRLMLPRPDRLW